MEGLSIINMDESKSDKFITRIKDLIDLDHVENKDIVLIVGPTGSGKSTVLNMIAGSKITCLKNEESDEWEFHADPSVTTIGHHTSETFLPVYWQDPSGNRFYDCPGFNDTRGIDYDIAKSYLLKKIGDCAKSLKVILVGDIYTLSAVRGGAFGKVVQQIKNLIPNFELTTDSELIVTKAPHSRKPCHISKKLKDTMNWSYPESKITIFYEPDEESGTFCDIDFFEIIGRSPSITTKCDFPLSDDAKFEINKLKDEFNKEIKETISVLSKRVNFCYLDLIQNNLEVSDDTLANWYKSFKDVESKIKNSTTLEKFQQNFDILIIGLKTFNGFLQIDDLSLFLKRKIENINFLKKISNEVEHLVSYWVSSFNFNYHPFSKGKNLAKFKKLEDFNSFLKEKNLDPQMDIRNQIHEVLNTSHNFSANYSGSKSHSGTADYAGEVNYSGHQLYSGTVNNCEELPYSGSVYYSGYQPYSGNVTVKSCYNPCNFCKGNVVNSSRCYSGSVYYSGYQPYSGSIKHFVNEAYSGKVDYSGSVPYSGKVDYNVTVPYSGSHVVTCQDHHTCSCEELSLIFLSAKELCEDIEYYQNIIKLQKQYLNSAQEDNEILLDSSNFKSFFSLNGKISLDDKIEQNDLTNKIHQTLKKILTFDVKYSDQVDHVVQKSYSGEASYSGNIPYSGTVSYCEDLAYSGSVYYYGYENYSGTVSTTKCSHDRGLFNVKCLICSHHDISIPYSGSVHYSGNQPYSGSIKHFVKEDYSGNIYYSGSKSYSGEVNHVISLPYSGTHTVTCQEDHHDCDSCDTWDSFVSGLTALLKEKEKHISIIEKRKATLVH